MDRCGQVSFSGVRNNHWVGLRAILVVSIPDGRYEVIETGAADETESA